MSSDILVFVQTRQLGQGPNEDYCWYPKDASNQDEPISFFKQLRNLPEYEPFIVVKMISKFDYQFYFLPRKVNIFEILLGNFPTAQFDWSNSEVSNSVYIKVKETSENEEFLSRLIGASLDWFKQRNTKLNECFTQNITHDQFSVTIDIDSLKKSILGCRQMTSRETRDLKSKKGIVLKSPENIRLSNI